MQYQLTDLAHDNCIQPVIDEVARDEFQIAAHHNPNLCNQCQDGAIIQNDEISGDVFL